VGWIASDGDDAAIVQNGVMVVMKPGQRAYATDLWSARRGLKHAADPEGARADLFNCDRKGCTPKLGTWPALGTWWSERAPSFGQVVAICQASDVVVLRSEPDKRPDACNGKRVIGPAELAKGGSAELFAEKAGFRLAWAEPIRGARPWTGAGEPVSDSDE
jgi:competence protein ComEC